MTEYTNLDLLQRIRRLQQALTENPNPLSDVEDIFLAYSSLQPPTVLSVVEPTYFPVSGAKLQHLTEARQKLGLPVVATDAVTLLGTPTSEEECGALPPLVITSYEQGLASPACREDTAILPLLQAAFTQRAALIKEFTVREALTGAIVQSLGQVRLDQLERHVYRAQPGEYTLQVRLETPNGSVGSLRAFRASLAALCATPTGEHILNPETFQSLVADGVALRSRLGALGRYSAADEQDISVSVRSVITHHHGGIQYHFSVGAENIVIYDGENPYPSLSERDGFSVLALSDKPACIDRLVTTGLLTGNETTVRRRMEHVASLIETMRAAGTPQDRIDTLESGAHSFEQVAQSLHYQPTRAAAAAYLKKLPVRLLEYVLVPTRDDIALHLLLPKLYSRPGAEVYQQTEQFKQRFDTLAESERQDMLRAVTSQILFRHEQNLDVNLWLYRNHRELCQRTNISFALEQN